MIFDLHCDTLMKLLDASKRGEEAFLSQNSFQIDEVKLSKSGYFAQCFAAFVPVSQMDPYATCKEMIDIFKKEIQRSERLRSVCKFEDFSKNHEQGKISAVLTMEDAAPIGKEMQRLREFYDLGVRMIGLTWNYPNAVGYPNYRNFDGVSKPDFFTPETENGLTEFGVEAVREMNRLGIVVDVSHLSDKGFFDVLKASEKPIIASHSNARGLCPNVRNLTDEMLKALADNGGVVGMNYAADFLDCDSARGKQTVERVVEHMGYVKNEIGCEHIAIGSDFDGIPPDIELKDASFLPLLVQAMDKAGFTIEEIEQITYRNALRVFRECMKD
ncbi:MAG: dipeptidase [Clostridia bacterium]|nr:dipeptidase [Clostridia bacterium]